MATFWPTPKAGDIVDCRFPQDKLPIPGPKERPALVTKVETFMDQGGAIHVIVDVAYGTSQDTQNVYPGEFVVAKRHPGSGLSKATKFDLGNLFRLNFDDEWFSPANPPHPSVPPKRGMLKPGSDQAVKRKISSALAELSKIGKIKKRTI